MNLEEDSSLLWSSGEDRFSGIQTFEEVSCSEVEHLSAGSVSPSVLASRKTFARDCLRQHRSVHSVSRTASDVTNTNEQPTTTALNGKFFDGRVFIPAGSVKQVD